MIGVLLLAHGSRENGSEQALELVKERVCKILNKKDLHFETAFLQFHKVDLSAGLDSLADLGYHEMLVIPYFLFDGRHFLQIQAAVEQYQNAHPNVRVRCGRTLEADPLLSQIVADRVTELLDGQEGIL